MSSREIVSARAPVPGPIRYSRSLRGALKRLYRAIMAKSGIRGKSNRKPWTVVIHAGTGELL